MIASTGVLDEVDISACNGLEQSCWQLPGARLF
jgi:hypothetical protein